MVPPVCPPYRHEHDPAGPLSARYSDPSMKGLTNNYARNHRDTPFADQAVHPITTHHQLPSSSPHPASAAPIEPSNTCCNRPHNHGLHHTGPVTMQHNKTPTSIHQSPFADVDQGYGLSSASDSTNPYPHSPNRTRAHQRAPLVNRGFASQRPPIYFYSKHDPYYGFTNFSAHPVDYHGKRYPTSEHLFQSLKFAHRPDLAEHIRTFSDRPSVAFSEARRFSPEIRPDWQQENITVMDEVIWHKFTQHRFLKEELLATGDAALVEDSDKDAFWGIGANHRGRNELGKALERLRDKLRDQRPG